MNFVSESIQMDQHMDAVKARAERDPVVLRLEKLTRRVQELSSAARHTEPPVAAAKALLRALAEGDRGKIEAARAAFRIAFLDQRAAMLFTAVGPGLAGELERDATRARIAASRNIGGSA